MGFDQSEHAQGPIYIIKKDNQSPSIGSQSTFLCLHYFLVTMLLNHRGTPTWQLYTVLCKFVQNISTNTCGLGKRKDLKLGEVSTLSISYICIS